MPLAGLPNQNNVKHRHNTKKNFPRGDNYGFLDQVLQPKLSEIKPEAPNLVLILCVLSSFL